MKQKIIFLDIDGTLTMPGRNEPPASAREAIAQARRAGHLVFLCTGRNYEMLRPLLAYGFDGVIASMGGYIECQGKVIFDCPMTERQRRTALEVLRENGVFRTVECMDGAYTDEGLKEFLRRHAAQGNNSELLRWREQLERELNIRPMSEYRGQPVYKILVTSLSWERLQKPREVLEEEFLFCMQEKEEDGFLGGEIVNRKFDKGQALGRVCEYLSIPVCDSVAFGDSINDEQMLRAAGLGICMENGSRRLRELADDICPSVEKDGIRSAFEKLCLIPAGKGEIL